MNRLTIIGNLCQNPEKRVTQDGTTVCNFTVAVNRYGNNGADFFRVSAWRQLGENCGKYLAKGKKVCVIGSVSVRTYQDNNGETRAQMEVKADEVEFLSANTQEQDQLPM